MKAPSFRTVRIILFVLFVMAVVCVPFIIWGEEYVGTLLKAQEHRAIWLVVISIILLAADSVAPVPATVVIMFLAAKAGTLAGIIGGTLGMTAGVLAAAWFGRVAVGRIAPKFFPDNELSRLRGSLQQRLGLTLACLRSVPVLAETSVIIAAAMGIPLKRIVTVTLLPNLAVSLIYSLAADDSFQTACFAFLGTLAASAVLWFWLRNRN